MSNYKLYCDLTRIDTNSIFFYVDINIIKRTDYFGNINNDLNDENLFELEEDFDQKIIEKKIIPIIDKNLTLSAIIVAMG